jgi:hypothetical protein
MVLTNNIKLYRNESIDEKDELDAGVSSAGSFL